MTLKIMTLDATNSSLSSLATSPISSNPFEAPPGRHSVGNQFQGWITRFLRRHVISILYMYLLIVEFGNYFQNAPRAAIYEDIICRQFYDSDRESHLRWDRNFGCKDREVQDELAFVRGLQEMFECLPGLLLAMPYGHLANRYSRKMILFIALLGMCLQYTWVLIVTWYSSILPLRLVWFSATFLVIGGGQSVSRSLAFVIVSDVTEERRRATIFFRIEAVALIARAAASALSSLTMSNNLWLPMFLGLGLIYVGSFFALLLPSTRSGNEGALFRGQILDSEPDETTTLLSNGRTKSSQSMWETIWKAMSRDKRVLLILILAVLGQLSSRTTGLLLQYASKRYEWSFARANMLLVLRMVTTTIALLGIIPLITKILRRLPSNLQPHSRDLFLMRLSTIFLAIGLAIMTFAANSGLMVIGVIVFSCGFGAFSAMRSVLTTLVLEKNSLLARSQTAPKDEGKSHISILYAAMSLGQTVAKAAAGPVYAFLFQKGQRLGAIGQGLPFGFAALLALVVHCATWIMEL